MITLKIFFNKIDFLVLTENLKNLPAIIQPVYFSDTEEYFEKVNKVSNKIKFKYFLTNNTLGFFLFSENNLCIDISLKNPPYIALTIDMPKDHIDSIDDIFRSLTYNKPIFGFASYDPERKFDEKRGYVINNYIETESEYEYRNRHFKKIGKFNCEAWIGLNLNKYISGLYWHTLVSKKIADKFRIDLSLLKNHSLKYQIFYEGCEEEVFLFRFYKKPEEWKKYANKLDNLCNKITGIFSRKDIDYQLKNIDDMFLYDEIVDVENDV